MAPSACLSPVVTLALLLLIAGFAVGGEFIFSVNLQVQIKYIYHHQFFPLFFFFSFSSFFFGGGGDWVGEGGRDID